MENCDHTKLRLTPTSHAAEIGYKTASRQTPQQSAAPTTAQGSAKVVPQKTKNIGTDDEIKYSSVLIGTPSSFPAPLILPNDDLALDPLYPPQSRRAWINEKDRNKVTDQRKTIYVAAPPDIDPEVGFVRTWTQPVIHSRDRGRPDAVPAIAQPRIKDVINYLVAFYNGLAVKRLPQESFRFTSWESDVSRASKTKGKSQGHKGPSFIGFSTTTECIRIRTRSSDHGDYTHQLNLNDLLDAAIATLPEDAYALILMVEHDLYEDDDDEFVCGRAYGGSRVAVVSTARYHPVLDAKQGLERQHSWPASHCETYLQRCLAASASKPAPKRTKRIQQSAGSDETSSKLASDLSRTSASINKETVPPLQAAVNAHSALPSLDLPSVAALSGLWLGRVCRTVSHELGHCFGLDHCVYYACAMQGSASIIEDARQPPYLCPVDLAKVLQATGSDLEHHYLALLAFCDQHRGTHMFAAFGAWISSRLFEIGIIHDDEEDDERSYITISD